MMRAARAAVGITDRWSGKLPVKAQAVFAYLAYGAGCKRAQTAEWLEVTERWVDRLLKDVRTHGCYLAEANIAVGMIAEETKE